MSPALVRELTYDVLGQELSARRYTKASRTHAMNAAREFLRWASRRGSPDILSFGKATLRSYHTWLCNQTSKRTGEALAANTINSRFAIVRLIYACLYRGGYLPENQAHGLACTLPLPNVYRRRPFTREEVDTFLADTSVGGALGLRDRTVFELIYSSGLRVSEAVALKVGDIDLERRLMVVRGKFDRDRMVPISEVARDFLVHYLGERAGQREDWVFPGRRGHLRSTSLSERCREVLKRCGLNKPELSTHSLRHATATHLLENGASIRHVQELLGHSNLESTARYTQVMSDGLAKVYRRYHPREHELYEEMDDTYQKKLASLGTVGLH